MSSSRRRKGFERAGELRPAELGLKRPQSRRLQLALAWKEVAGAALSQGVHVELARGLLDVAVSTPEMLSMLEPVAAEIAGRIAGQFPTLGVKRFRVHLADSREPGGPAIAVEPQAVPAPPADGNKPRRRSPIGTGTAEGQSPSTEELVARLSEAARRHLAGRKP